MDGPDYRAWSSPRTWQGEDIVIVNLRFSLTFVWLEEQVEQNRTESTSVSVWDFCFLDKSTLEDFGKIQKYIFQANADKMTLHADQDALNTLTKMLLIP